MLSSGSEEKFRSKKWRPLTKHVEYRWLSGVRSADFYPTVVQQLRLLNAAIIIIC